MSTSMFNRSLDGSCMDVVVNIPAARGEPQAPYPRPVGNVLSTYNARYRLRGCHWYWLLLCVACVSHRDGYFVTKKRRPFVKLTSRSIEGRAPRVDWFTTVISNNPGVADIVCLLGRHPQVVFCLCFLSITIQHPAMFLQIMSGI